MTAAKRALPARNHAGPLGLLNASLQSGTRAHAHTQRTYEQDLRHLGLHPRVEPLGHDGLDDSLEAPRHAALRQREQGREGGVERKL